MCSFLQSACHEMTVNNNAGIKSEVDTSRKLEVRKDSFLFSKGLVSGSHMTLLKKNGPNFKWMDSVIFNLKKDTLVVNFIKYSYSYMSRNTVFKLNKDTLNVDFKIEFPDSETLGRAEYLEKYQLKIPLRKYKFQYLVFPEAGIVKNVKSIKKL